MEGAAGGIEGNAGGIDGTAGGIFDCGTTTQDGERGSVVGVGFVGAPLGSS